MSLIQSMRHELCAMDFHNTQQKIIKFATRYGVGILYGLAVVLVGFGWWRFAQSSIPAWSVAVVAYRPYTPFFLASPRFVHAVGFVASLCILANIVLTIILWRHRDRTKKIFQKEQFLLAGGALGVAILIFIYFAGIIAIQ